MVAKVDLYFTARFSTNPLKLTFFEIDLSKSKVHWEDGPASSRESLSPKGNATGKLNVFARILVGHKLGFHEDIGHFVNQLKSLRLKAGESNQGLRLLGGTRASGVGRIRDLFEDPEPPVGMPLRINDDMLKSRCINVFVRACADDAKFEPATNEQLQALHAGIHPTTGKLVAPEADELDHLTNDPLVSKSSRKSSTNDQQPNDACVAYDVLIATAQQHCERYETIYSYLSGFDEDVSLPRERLAISRNTCDLESDRAHQRMPNPLAPPQLFAERDLIDQLASRTRRRLWILGGGGIGKTEFSKLCALRLAEKFREQPLTAVIPIRVELKSLDPAVPCNSSNRLLHNHLVPDEIEWIRPYLEAGRIAFILDGMDELRIDRNTFNDALLKLILQCRACAFVITGRGNSIDPELSMPHCFDIDSVHVLKLVTLEQATTYIKAFFSVKERAELATPLVKLMERDPTLLELVCNSPLLLAMACQVHLAHRQITSNPLDIIERGLEAMFERRRSRFTGTSDELPEDTICLKAISCLAAYSYLGRTDVRQSSLSFTRQNAITWLRENRIAFLSVGISLDSDDAARKLILQLTPASGVIGWSSRNCITFHHRVLIEFLAARWVVDEGYPHWPYYANPYTSLPDVLDRQIADFFGDAYWSLELEGVRYWMFYLLERRKPSLFETLIGWQQYTLATIGSTLPRQVFIPDDIFRAIVKRLLDATEQLRRIGSERMADRIFNSLIEEIGFETIATHHSQWKLLEVCSRKYFHETLRFCYSGSETGKPSGLAYQLMSAFSNFFSHRRQADGREIKTWEIWQISLNYSYSLLEAKYVETSAWGDGTLLWEDVYLSGPRGRKFQWSDQDIQVLIDCVQTQSLPTLGFRLWDVLLFLLAHPPNDVNVRILLCGLRAKLLETDGIERFFAEVATLLEAASDLECSLVSAVADIYLERLHEAKGRQIRRAMQSFFKIQQPTTHLMKRLCDLPTQLLAADRIDDAAATELASIIANCVASSNHHGDPLIDNMLSRLITVHGCKEAALARATRTQVGDELFTAARELIVASITRELWQGGIGMIERLEWLKTVEPFTFEDCKSRMIRLAEESLKCDHLSVAFAAQVLQAPKIRQFIEFPAGLYDQAESLLALSIKEFGRGLADAIIWEQFERDTPEWPRDATFVASLSGFSKPYNDQNESQFLLLLLAYVRKHDDCAGESADRIIQRLCEIGVDQEVDWVKAEPVRELLKEFMLLAIRVRTGKTLVDAADVITIAADKWFDDAEIRPACIELVTQSIESAAHQSVLEKAGKALIEGWPRSVSVFRGLVGAGLGHLYNESTVFDQLLLLWENEGTTAWLPECSSGFERFPIELESVRGLLATCIRENIRRGLPAEVLSVHR